MLMPGGIGLPVPEDATLILCGFLAAHDVARPLPALAILYPGLLIADSLLFGRHIAGLRIQLLPDAGCCACPTGRSCSPMRFPRSSRSLS
jgi:membrane protein DedA with SNARE-associated domain